MRKLIVLHDSKEANGKTIKENNLARKHRYPIGSLVELNTGARLFVQYHGRDCDGTPLYNLAVKVHENWFQQLHLNYGEDSLILIKLPETVPQSARQWWGDCIMCTFSDPLGMKGLGWECFCQYIEATTSNVEI